MKNCKSEIRNSKCFGNWDLGFKILQLGFLFLSCSSPQAKKAPPVLQTRCVSLVPSVTEIIYALGGERMLVGNSNQCDYPEEAKRVYKVGDFQAPDIERILALKPTLVFATLPIHRQLIEKLAELKVEVYISQPKDINEVFAEIESIGVLLGKSDRAKALVTNLKSQLSSLPNFSDTPRVYLEIAQSPLMSVGHDVFINDIITRAGGRNIFAFSPNPYPVIDPEMVVRYDPEVIIILHPGTNLKDVKARLSWDKISAVRQGKVYAGLDEDLFFRPGPRVVEGIFLLARLLHPEEIDEARNL